MRLCADYSMKNLKPSSLVLLQHEEPEAGAEFKNPSMIAIPTTSSNHDNDNLSKLKMKDITNKKRKKNFNPLLHESVELSDDIRRPPKPTRFNSFILTTNTGKTVDTPPSTFYNVYCMCLAANAFLIGSLILFIINIPIIGSFFLVIGIMLDIYTLWAFCGNRICPRCFKHENKLVFDNTDQRLYIHWNALIKQSSVRYNDFARLYVRETLSTKYGIVYIATSLKHYRLNKYLCEITKGKEFVATVNNWWNVDRLEEQQRVYNNRSVLVERVRNRREQLETLKEEEEVKTEEELYLENEKELSKLIKKMKYKSFSEKEIENASKLKAFYESRYKGKMVEEYRNIKMDLENKAKTEENEVLFKNQEQYIIFALVLKFETLDQLIQERKKSRGNDEEEDKDEESEEHKSDALL